MTDRHQKLRCGGQAINSVLFASVTVAALLSGGSAFAQTSEAGTIEEVVVTARRTAEKLQDIPLAVSAFSERSLRANNVINLQSLNGLAPSLNYQSSGARTSSGRVFFRGLTTGAGGQASKASIFVDGNYIAGSAQNIPFNYFERVEALPGPQSAQFGRATFGGAVNYITKSPTSTLSGVVHADYASYGDVTVDGLIAGPLFESATGGRLTASAFASYQQYDAPDGLVTPPDILHPKGIRQTAQESQFYALKANFEATEDLTFRFGATYAEFHDQPGTFFLTPPGPLKNGAFQRYTGNNLATPTPGVFLYYPVGSLAYGNDYLKDGIGLVQNFYNIRDPRIHDYNYRYSAGMDWRIADHDVTLNYMHEFERNKQGGSDGDNTYFPASSVLNIRNRIESDALELRIASPSENRFRYTVGAYYINFDTANEFTLFAPFRCTSTTVGCTTTNPAALFNPTLVNGALVGFTGTAAVANTSSLNRSTTDTTDKAAFGMLSFDVTEKLTASVEARYQIEDLVSTNPISGFVGKKTNKAFVPRVSLQYRFTPDVQMFAVYSVGNNPGGFNPFVGSFLTLGATTDDLSFKEERLKNYEVGIKSTLLDGRLVANATIFQMDWIDQVASETRTATNGLNYSLQANKGRSRVRGGEVQLTAIPMRGLTVGGTLSYNDAKYVSYCSSSAVNITGYSTPGRLNCVVSDGNFLENVPAMTMSMTAEYRWPLMGDWEGVVGGAYRYRDGQWESDQNLAKSAAQNIVDLRVGMESDRYTVSLFCSNCSDETATDRATNLADVRLTATVTANRTASFAPRRPRQIGVRTALKF